MRSAISLNFVRKVTGKIMGSEAEGVGYEVLTRLDELLDRYSGCLQTGGDLRKRVEGLREEWR
jgi:hypothetical protein